MQFQLIRNPKHYLFIAVTNHLNGKKETRTRVEVEMLRRGIADSSFQVLIQ